MAYIGVSPSNGVRRVHTYTATASQTTFTGASSEGVTLSYADTNYIDVFQNGVLLGSADYTSTSGTSVVLAQGASADDLIVIVVYDVFSVADTVSKTNGGTFDNGITIDADGATVLTVDRATSDGTIVDLQKSGSTVGSIGTEGTYGSGPQFLGSNSRGLVIVNPNTSINEIIPNVDTVGKLGNSSNRWADLYLSGGAYIGGTGSANYLDDYEEGTWTPVFGSTGGGVTSDAVYSVQNGAYTKIGNRVHVNFHIVTTSKGTIGSSTARIFGFPFNSSATNITGSIRFDNIGVNAVSFGPRGMYNTPLLSLDIKASDSANYSEAGATSFFTDTTSCYGYISYYVA